ncbi:MAG: TadE/TadG family type IV pilus assembly protein [Myxococcales bacterium]
MASKKNRAGQRGQAIVLLAVTGIILAFTVLTTLAIGSAVENRIRLQQTADAAAYSMAVQEARTFNYFAFSNRAIVAHYVAIMSIYGYMSYLALYEGYLNQLCLNWGCFSQQCFTNQMQAAGVSSSDISNQQNAVNSTSSAAQSAGAALATDKQALVSAQQQLSADQAQQSSDCGADPNGSACAADNTAVSNDQNAVNTAQNNVNTDQNNLNNAQGNLSSTNSSPPPGANAAVYASLIDNIPTELLLECIGWCVAAAASFGALAQQCEACTQCDAQEIPNIEDNICQNINSAISDVDGKLGKTGGSAIADLKDFATYHLDAIKGYSKVQQLLSDTLAASFVDMPQDIAHAADPAISVPNSVVLAGVNTKAYCTANTGCSAVPVVGGKGGNLLDAQWKAANATRHGNFLELSSGADWLINRNELSISPMLGALNLAAFGGVGGLASNAAELRFNAITGSGMSELITQTSGDVHSDVHNNSAGEFAVAGEDHGRVVSTDESCIESGAIEITVATPAFDVQVWAYSEPENVASGSSCGGPGTSQLHWEDGSTSTNQSGQNPIDLLLGGCSDGNAGLGVPTANFNVQSSSSDPLLGQPKTWAILSRSFSSDPGNANWQGPFAMTPEFSLFTGSGTGHDNNNQFDDTITDHVPWSSMVALSQGLAYYHRPGDWKEPPNFYNPFWRAKLHPLMSKGDLTELAVGATQSVSNLSASAAANVAPLLTLPLTE